MLIDLDRFKQVNDTYGHEHGNDLLHQVGHRLAALDPPVALAAHLSGDEFALVVHGDDTDVETAAYAARQHICGHPYDIAGRQLTITASVGHAVAGPGMLPRDLLQAADHAMYLTKRRNGGDPTHDNPSNDTPPTPVTRYRDLR